MEPGLTGQAGWPTDEIQVNFEIFKSIGIFAAFNKDTA